MVRNLWVGDFFDLVYLLFGGAFADENHDCYDNAEMMMIFHSFPVGAFQKHPEKNFLYDL